MILPPVLIYIDICNKRNNRIRLWLPVIILWPLLLVAAIIVIPLAAVAEALLFATGIKPLSILIGVSRLIAALHGTDIEVVSRKAANYQQIKINIQ